MILVRGFQRVGPLQHAFGGPGCPFQTQAHVPLCRSLGQLVSNLKHELPVRLIRPPKVSEEFFLPFIQDFQCARGNGLGLPISLKEYPQGIRLFSTGVSSSLERVVKS
jgi:hypothetical protein